MRRFQAARCPDVGANLAADKNERMNPSCARMFHCVAASTVLSGYFKEAGVIFGALMR